MKFANETMLFDKKTCCGKKEIEHQDNLVFTVYFHV